MKRTKRDSKPNLPEPAQAVSTAVWSLVASLLTWAAFPPLGWFPLAWFAPVAWARLIQADALSGRRPYWVIWSVSALAWGILLEGVGRAFWANYFGLALMGGYLGVYQVLFVGLSRVAVHRWKLSIVIAAPAVWTGLELVRGYLITGFSMALLGHTQVKITSLIQIADVFGAYGVSFLVVFVGSCVASSIRQKEVRSRAAPLLIAAGVLVCVYVYGLNQMAALRQIPVDGHLQVALLQGTEDTILDSDREAAEQRSIATFNQYWDLMSDVSAKHDDIGLIVWPEGMFSGGLPQVNVNGNVIPPPDAKIDAAKFAENIELMRRLFNQKTRAAASLINRSNIERGTGNQRTYLLAGCDAVELSGSTQQTYNSGLLIDPSGDVAGRYDKMHRVLIGEYVPLGDRFPFLYDLLPIGRGLTPGAQPQLFEVHGVNIAPSICFEDTVPHLIRRQVRQLTADGGRPDLLVNLTNDGWFWGSAVLDLQLNCAIFRAVELRRPVLVAANTGLTVSINSNGSVLDSLPRRKEGVIVTDVAIRHRDSLYERWGDVFAGVCLLVCVALLGSVCRDRWRNGE